MKRYHYKKWFCNIMKCIPIRIVRVLVLFFIMLGTLIFDAVSALIATIIDDYRGQDFKGVIGDIWYWKERGEKYDGHVGGH